MTDYIDRQAAIDAIVNTVSDVGLHDNSETARYGATYRQQEILTILESLPSADRPQGEWIDADGNFVPLDKDGCTTAPAWCSNCGEWLTGSDEYCTSGRFCPNCGARMDGIEE